MTVTLGYNSPTFQSAYWAGLNNTNQMAIKVTAPSTGVTVTDLYAYFGGYGQTTSARLCIWNDDANKTLHAMSSAFTAPSYGLSVGGQGWQHATISATFNDGVSFWIGWWRDAAKSQVWSEQNSPALVEWLMTNTSGSPGPLGTSNSAGSGIPGIYCQGTAGTGGNGGLKIWSGSGWLFHKVKTWDATQWNWNPVKEWDGSSWKRRG
jgi:hypothetical protein